MKTLPFISFYFISFIRLGQCLRACLSTNVCSCLYLSIETKGKYSISKVMFILLEILLLKNMQSIKENLYIHVCMWVILLLLIQS